MSTDIAVTRRRKMLAFLVEQGGSAGLAEANQFSESKLLAAHQAFSAIMEGLVDGGYVTWDGTTFVVTAAGKEEAALAPKPRARKGAKAAADVTVAPTAAVEATPAAGAHDHGHSHDHGRDEAQDHGHSHDHGRDEAQDHGHRHDHGGGAAPRSTTTTPPPRPRPTVEPPRRGLRARALGLIRRLFAK
jgi:hypothetical protein